MDIATTELNNMSSATIHGDDHADIPARETSVNKPRRKSTSHLKLVPPTLQEREEIKNAAEDYAKAFNKERAFTKNELEQHSRLLLEKMELPEKYLGFAMVMLGNFFWKRQFLAIPFNKRMLLLPHCLKHAEGCPADYDEFGLDCEKCGACSIADYKVRAEELGYKVLVAEGSPVVLKIIVEGYVDGILGVACLNVLEKAIDKILIAGVPSYAVPLHTGDCKNTSLDEAWVWDVLEIYEPLEAPLTESYLPIMRASSKMFADDFAAVLPRLRSKGDKSDLKSPLALTESVSYDWLQHGGKRFRPFITLAAYAALNSEKEQNATSPTVSEELPLGVKRVAMAIEAFHKASLVHDDIQDDDHYRYGRETLHRIHGNGQAINIGDHLIGLGYHLLNTARVDLSADIVADIIGEMSKAHLRLCDGQGAEMSWNEDSALEIKPVDVMQIYALKTSPAFEAALFAGIRMAGPVGEYVEMIPNFCRHLGIAFQILNDLKDWQGDENNKLLSGQDAAKLRPTVLLALALQAASETQRENFKQLVHSGAKPAKLVEAMRILFAETQSLDKAQQLVDKSRARAEGLADNVSSEALRKLLYFLVDNVLAPEDTVKTEPTNLVSLPMV